MRKTLPKSRLSLLLSPFHRLSMRQANLYRIHRRNIASFQQNDPKWRMSEIMDIKGGIILMSFCRFYLSYLSFHVFQGGTDKVFNKKSSTILILKTLQEYSDEDHYLTHQQIIDRIKRDYGLEFERKSVATGIGLLQELGYDINKGPKGGFALFSRLFEPSEIQFITDALFSSKAISAKQAAALSSKAQSVLSRYQRKNYGYILKADQIARNESDEVFYAIDMIHESIKQEKAISFQMKEYDEDGHQVNTLDMDLNVDLADNKSISKEIWDKYLNPLGLELMDNGETAID
jgi:hypothetical protein